MNKEDVLKQLFKLPKEEILDIYEILNGFKTRTSKANKDTLLARCVFIKGYHRTIKKAKIKAIGVIECSL